EAVLRRALAKDPARRTPSGRELVEALRALPAGLLLPVGTTTPKDKVEPRAPIMPPEAQYRMGAETLKRLKEDGRPLRFSSSLSSRLREMSLSPTEGFILSRVDGTSKASEILALSPMPENEVAETIAELVHKGLITWDDPDSSASSGSKLDPALEKELGRLLDLGKRRRYSELLGVDVSTPPPQVKQSYLELIQRFHPEAHPKDLSLETRHRLSELCAVATRALTTLSRSRTKPPVPPKRVRSDFDRTRHAWEIFRRAERAYETTDYWDAIQLARQAIELDQEQASFYYLLGLGLMKNRNWLKEAEGHLRRAAELDPSKADYFGQLASVYKELGMVERSATMLEKAKAIDPNFSLS
ncbi:MAG TPA: protein kinase family protein, partial [Vicinamibacteria bacterium]|nr:protein kinase family protein [Vicinamibacteria bacterium]